MSSRPAGPRPITIAILAMGGEGGGVLADWIVEVADRAGYIAQNTSVAGVAQRTGATVYYIELFPPPDTVPAGGRGEPVLSVFPTPGEVDIVIASELMEAGRAVQRGFCTPDRTLLIASTNRVYAITERMAQADGRVDGTLLLEAARRGSKRFIGADFMALAQQASSVISASLLGALAGSGALPFARDGFEAAIRGSGKAADSSLAAFALGYDAARQPPQAARRAVPVTIGSRPPEAPVTATQAAEERRRAVATSHPEQLVGPGLRAHAARVGGQFPEAARSMLLRGCERTAVYQDPSYTDRYLDRVARVAALEPDGSDARLTTEAARHVALWMCYQDTIHVALQKIRRRRLAAVRQEAGAAAEQPMQVREYLHPQVEEITDTLPLGLGRWLAGSALFRRLVGRMTRDGIVVRTMSIIGFTLLWMMAALRPLRPRSLRFAREQAAIDSWLDLAVETARIGTTAAYDLACEIVECQRVLKGYGQTHQHGAESFAVLMAAVPTLSGRAGAARTLAQLRSAALADEDGAALRNAVAALDAEPTGRSA